jgi:hypothetical protein
VLRSAALFQIILQIQISIQNKIVNPRQLTKYYSHRSLFLERKYEKQNLLLSHQSPGYKRLNFPCIYLES